MILIFRRFKIGTWAFAFFYFILQSVSLPAADWSKDPPLILPGTQKLELQGDLSAQMIEGIDRFLMEATRDSVFSRSAFWNRDFSSPMAYEESVKSNRKEFRRIIGAVDERQPVTALEYRSNTLRSSILWENKQYTIHAVRWPVLEGVYGEGLLLQPKEKAKVRARVIALPDAAHTPEMLVGLEPGLPPEKQFARRLVETGCQVVVPALINRDDQWSGNPDIGKWTNQPHREWIYRQAYEMGRHVIGYEVQTIHAVVDWFLFDAFSDPNARTDFKIGVMGHGEGGLLALYAAALDSRIDSVLVSGYFQSRQNLWQEPIDRNLFGLLERFGDAEIAGMIAPRGFIVEHSRAPEWEGPPPARNGRRGAAPGRIENPSYTDVEAEVRRLKSWMKEAESWDWEPRLIHGNEGMAIGPGSNEALATFLDDLKVEGFPSDDSVVGPEPGATIPAGRQKRLVRQREEFTQSLMRKSNRVRRKFFWDQMEFSEPRQWSEAAEPFRNYFWEEVIGRFGDPSLPPQPHSRLAFEEQGWVGYEVVVNVWPNVFAWGYLLLPSDLNEEQPRPVVVCQHGLEGLPSDLILKDPSSRAFSYYKNFAAQLAQRGFIVFVPHNPYRGGNDFRVLQRKANPLKKSLFSIIIGQHQAILDWLADQQFVDASRIGFYGLSYGGKTAMRVPALLNGYSLSICSADFNEWIRKNVTVESPYSYMYTGEYEMPEFNLGHTFNYAEMAGLIAPRPFMVERGHRDGVAPDEWVAAEYATVRRAYTYLGVPHRTRIEFFKGPHTIHGEGTFEFLHEKLDWPVPESLRPGQED